MLTGKSFRLKRAVLALETVEGVQTAEHLPLGAIVEVVSESNGTDPRMLDVEWTGRRFAMFTIDFHECGEALEAAFQPKQSHPSLS